jgi:starvation-inducible DNA-binding protein
VAERARTVGGHSVATLNEFVEAAWLKELPGQYPSVDDMLENLLSDHEALIRQLRADADAAPSKYHDAGTNDFLTSLMEEHEKMAWMLRSFQEQLPDQERVMPPDAPGEHGSRCCREESGRS